MTHFFKLYKTTDCIKIRLGSKMDGGYVILDNLTNYDLFISCGAVNFNNKLLPNNIECTFVRNDLISNYELDNNEIPDPKLDNINIENTTEIKFNIN